MLRADVTPRAVKHGLREFGVHVSTWRKLQRLTMAQVAERANISRDTLRAIEQGAGTPSIENVMRVCRALGTLDVLYQSIDPYKTDVGRLRMDEILPVRVREGHDRHRP